MQIKDIKNYKLTDSGFVLKQSKTWIGKVIIIAFLFLSVFIPVKVADAYREYTPEVITSPQHQQSKIAQKIISINPEIDEEEANKMVHYAKKWGSKFGVPPSLILGVMKTESTFNKYAISNMGAMGLMQILPKWHMEKLIQARKEIGNPEPFNIETNIYVGTWILKDCMRKYKEINSSLKCYNGSIGTKTDYHINVIDGKKKFENYI